MNGTCIVYSKEIGKHHYIAVAAETGNTWTLNTLTDAPFRQNPHATRNPADSSCAIQYISTLFNNYTKYKFLDDPGNEMWIHNFLDAHWANDEQLMTGIRKNNHQVGLFNPANPDIPVQLTFDYNKVYSRPFMWRAPEHQDARMFFAVANGEEVRVFKEILPGTNHYRLYMAFPSPSSNPLYLKIGSPEPCVYDGHSYLTFMASSTECETACFPGEIWIARLDSAAPVFRMVSDTSVAIRTDPESFATKDSLLVYYTEVVDSAGSPAVYRLKKCDTGIGIDLATGGHETAGAGASAWTVYPNPFGSHLSMKNAAGNEQFNLTDHLGKSIWRGEQLELADFSNLRAGLYFLKTRSGNSMQTTGVIKN
jgi:hypothetical protein